MSRYIALCVFLLVVGVPLVFTLLNPNPSTHDYRMPPEYARLSRHFDQSSTNFDAIHYRLQLLESQNHLLTRLVQQLSPGTMKQKGIVPTWAPAFETETDTAAAKSAFASLYENYRNGSDLQTMPGAAWTLTRRLQTTIYIRTPRTQVKPSDFDYSFKSVGRRTAPR